MIEYMNKLKEIESYIKKNQVRFLIHEYINNKN